VVPGRVNRIVLTPEKAGEYWGQCVGCHTIRGVAAGALGPDLTHFGSRALFGAGLWTTTPDNVAAWIKNPPALKPGSRMPNLGLSDADANALAVYLISLK
jgi:cytochrome c oxidase subunit II